MTALNCKPWSSFWDASPALPSRGSSLDGVAMTTAKGKVQSASKQSRVKSRNKNKNKIGGRCTGQMESIWDFGMMAGVQRSITIIDASFRCCMELETVRWSFQPIRTQALPEADKWMVSPPALEAHVL